MLRLIHADLYKIFHRFYFYIMAASLAALCVLVNLVLRTAGQYSAASFSWGFAVSMLSAPVFLMPMLTDIVSAEEYREHTLKNTLSFGTNRTSLYFSKAITSVLLGILLMAVVLVFYCGSSLIFLPRDAKFTGDLIREFFVRAAASCSVYIASIAMAVFLTVLFRHGSLAIFIFYGAFYLTEYLFKLLRISQLNRYTLKTQIGQIAGQPLAQLQTPVLISLVTMAVFLAAGAAVFHRRDIC
ncbi:MAG: ABC transporter permease [Oscillospiraceae bacterium]|nr:ABC transporter permease [Oscillospiraceae bacterium]